MVLFTQKYIIYFNINEEWNNFFKSLIYILGMLFIRA